MTIKSRLRTLFVAGLATLASFSLNAQSIDLGRGELPVTVPSGYDGTSPAPLIVLLHGYTSSGQMQDSYMGFSKIADDYGFFLVAPDGNRVTGGDENRFWNASAACCDFFRTAVDDSAYVSDIIRTMKSEYKIDNNRVYLIGHSNGGFMSYRAAYDHSDTIAAIASLAGANHIDEREAPASPVHVLQIHGTKDATIAYEGSEIQENYYPSALESVQRWASYNGCSSESSERELRDLVANLKGHESRVTRFGKGCKQGGSAELWTIEEGSHVPMLSGSFASQVVEWLYAHPKKVPSFAD